MVISGSQHPLKVNYRIPKYIIQLSENKIINVVVVVLIGADMINNDEHSY